MEERDAVTYALARIEDAFDTPQRRWLRGLTTELRWMNEPSEAELHEDAEYAMEGD